MNLDEIIERANFYTNLLWNKTLTCDIQINSRLKSTHGQFIHYDNGKELDKIELAKKLLNTEKFFIIDTLLHELTHWYLCSIGKDNRDGCKEFEDELIRIGVSSTETTRDRGNKTSFLKTLYVYECPKCKLELRIATYNGSNGYKCWRCCDDMKYRGNNQMEQFEFTPSDKLIDYEVKYLMAKQIKQ